MSDGFDKEAEREKLREKFAEDEQKREHTQRMSELLLKGATMTNRHCEDCGDPIFRHDGREFCPSCGNEVGGAAGANAEGTSTEAAADSPTAADSPAAANATPEGGADAGAGTANPDAGTVDPDADTTDAAAPSGRGEPRQSEPRRSPPDQHSGTERSAPQRSEPRRAESGRPASSGSPDDAAGLDGARASLTRTLTRFARAAEETDDPRRARDHLEAAREAAEALAALD